MLKPVHGQIKTFQAETWNWFFLLHEYPPIHIPGATIPVLFYFIQNYTETLVAHSLSLQVTENYHQPIYIITTFKKKKKYKKAIYLQKQENQNLNLQWTIRSLNDFFNLTQFKGHLSGYKQQTNIETYTGAQSLR